MTDHDTGFERDRLQEENARLSARVEELEASLRAGTAEAFGRVARALPMGVHLYELGPGGALLFRGGNVAADRLLGIEGVRLVGRAIEEAFPGLVDTAIPDAYRETARTGEPYTEEQALYRDGEGEGTFEVHAFQPAAGQVAVLFIDVTERCRAERELETSEARLRTLAGLAEEGIVIHDQGVIVEANEAVARLAGYSVEELIGVSTARLVTPVSWEVVRRNIERAHQHPYEIEVVHRDGHSIPCELTGKRYRHEGRTYRVVTVRDISRLKATQAALRESEQRFQTLFERASDGMLVVDAETRRFVFANEAIGRMLGYSREALHEMSMEDIHPADALPEVREAFERQRRGELVVATDLPMQRGDGSIFFADISSAELHLRGRSHVLGSFRDVTSRRQAQRSLEASEERFRRMADSIHDGLTVIEGERITYVNDRACEIFGYPRDELVRKDPFSLVAVEDRQRLISMYRARRDGFAEGGEVEFWVARGDGSRRRVRNRYAERVIDGEVRARYVVSTDVTEQRRAEEERRRLEEMFQHAQKLESLGVLAGGIAHDFNNLLVGILGNAGLALLKLDGASAGRGNVQAIEDAATRASELCRQLLAYSGRGRFVVGHYDLAELVREMGPLLDVSVSRRLSVSYELAEGLPPIEADATQLRQVVMNLVTNAAEAMEGRAGSVQVLVGVRQCTRDDLTRAWLATDLEPGRYVYLEVRDRGGGMTPETRARIFDPFFTTKFTGRGLGLSAVLGIVRGHDGAIEVDSTLGEGTTVRVLLPLASELAPEEIPSSPPTEPWTGGGTVLLVDDDTAVREVGGEMLEILGFDVLYAANGEEAVRVFDAHTGEITLVLLDLTMPELDGRATFEALRRRCAKLPIVLTSGYDEHDAVASFTEGELAGFVQKPFSIKALGPALREALQ